MTLEWENLENGLRQISEVANLFLKELELEIAVVNVVAAPKFVTPALPVVRVTLA